MCVGWFGVAGHGFLGAPALVVSARRREARTRALCDKLQVREHSSARTKRVFLNFRPCTNLQELNRGLESSQAAVLNLSAQSTAHASLLGVHDGLLGNNKSVQGITKSYGGIL